MIVLADMWITLSEPYNGVCIDEIVLSGELTGRREDRRFKCIQPSTMPHQGKDETWRDYLYKAVDYIDFVELKEGESCLSDSVESPEVEKTP